MDELNTPLGLENKDASAATPYGFAKILAGLGLIGVGAVVSWAYFAGDPQSPQLPSAAVTGDGKKVTAIEAAPLRPGTSSSERVLTKSDAQKPARLDEMQADGALEEPTITFIKPTSSGPQKLSHLPDKSLTEKSVFGLLPRKSKSGKRPLDAYARPVLGAGPTRIAIIVGGLGLSQSGSKSAIEQLPGAVTLAFAPYGNSLGRWMKMARQDGHELLMQVPMEPIGYPTVNPGKHTLVTNTAAGKNLESLHWSMARMTNYTGIMNYLGARILADEGALGPVFGEIAGRGLLFLDDGSTRESKAESVAKTVGLPFLKGNIVLDAGRSAAEIKKNLLLLEKLARRRGMAIGMASAFPKSVKSIAAWAKQAEKRGVELVPVSALLQ